MLCGKWNEKEERDQTTLRVYPSMHHKDVWVNYATSLMTAVLFERMQHAGILTIYKNFWNGQKVWQQESHYMSNVREMAESFIVEKYQRLKLEDKSLKSGMFCGILPIRFATVRERVDYWRGCFVEEDNDQKSVSLLDVSSGLGNPNLGLVYQQLMMLIEKVNNFFMHLFSGDWLDLDKLDLWFAVDANQKVKLAAFDFQVSFHGIPIVLNNDYMDNSALLPRLVNMEMFARCKDEYEVEIWERESKFMYWHIVNNLLQLRDNVFPDSMDFTDTADKYLHAFYMMKTP